MQIFRQRARKNRYLQLESDHYAKSGIELTTWSDVIKATEEKNQLEKTKSSEPNIFSVGEPQIHTSKIGYKDGLAYIKVEPPLIGDQIDEVAFAMQSFLRNVANQRGNVEIVKGVFATGFILETDHVAGERAILAVDEVLEKIDQEAGVNWGSSGIESTEVIDVNCR